MLTTEALVADIREGYEKKRAQQLAVTAADLAAGRRRNRLTCAPAA